MILKGIHTSDPLIALTGGCNAIRIWDFWPRETGDTVNNSPWQFPNFESVKPVAPSDQITLWLELSQFNSMRRVPKIYKDKGLFVLINPGVPAPWRLDKNNIPILISDGRIGISPWQQYCHAVGKDICGTPTENAVADAVEIWNEINPWLLLSKPPTNWLTSEEFDTAADIFLNICDQASQVFRTYGLLTIGGSFLGIGQQNYNSREFMRRCLKKGLGDICDGISFHYPPVHSPRWSESFIKSLRNYTNLIFITETNGLSTISGLKPMSLTTQWDAQRTADGIFYYYAEEDSSTSHLENIGKLGIADTRLITYKNLK